MTSITIGDWRYSLSKALLDADGWHSACFRSPMRAASQTLPGSSQVGHVGCRFWRSLAISLGARSLGMV